MTMTDVAQILNAIEQGDPSASDKLLPLVYEELRMLARQRLANEKPGQTPQATAMVHEAYLRLVGKDNEPSWTNRCHFFASAAEAMRRILVENAWRKLTIKHGHQHLSRPSINASQMGKITRVTTPRFCDNAQPLLRQRWSAFRDVTLLCASSPVNSSHLARI